MVDWRGNHTNGQLLMGPLVKSVIFELVCVAPKVQREGI